MSLSLRHCKVVVVSTTTYLSSWLKSWVYGILVLLFQTDLVCKEKVVAWNLRHVIAEIHIEVTAASPLLCWLLLFKVSATKLGVTSINGNRFSIVAQHHLSREVFGVNFATIKVWIRGFIGLPHSKLFAVHNFTKSWALTNPERRARSPKKGGLFSLRYNVVNVSGDGHLSLRTLVHPILSEQKLLLVIRLRLHRLFRCGHAVCWVWVYVLRLGQALKVGQTFQRPHFNLPLLVIDSLLQRQVRWFHLNVLLLLQLEINGSTHGSELVFSGIE